ncbi:S-layer homology domain-containing protein [Sporomusa aerivorans]|uniref:S-layer homology domain-containing protein n=1 Tax=Sporomusa aerivorans TaxID=204936 RepID=UPI00352B82E3
MRKVVFLVLVLFLFSFAAVAFAAANPFGDIPANHWAYDAVTRLSSDGIVDGYSDRTFRGNNVLTRYEMALIVVQALKRVDKANEEDKALINKLATEFAGELKTLGAEIKTIKEKQDKLTITGDLQLGYHHDSLPAGNEAAGTERLKGSQKFTFADKNFFTYKVNDKMNVNLTLEMGGDQHIGNTTAAVKMTGASAMMFDTMGFDMIWAGRQPIHDIGIGLLARPSNADGIFLKKTLGGVEATTYIANVNSPAFMTSPSQINPVLGNFQLGTKVSDNLGLRAGYYWSTVNGSTDANLAYTNGNYLGTSFQKSQGLDISADYKFGGLTLLAEYIDTRLADRSVLSGYTTLPKNPTAWALFLTNGQTTIPHTTWPASDIVDHKTVGQSAWAVGYFECGAGAVPPYTNGWDFQWNKNYVGSPSYEQQDNTKTLFLLYQKVIAPNTNLQLAYWQVKYKDLSLLPGYTDESGKLYQVKLDFFY